MMLWGGRRMGRKKKGKDLVGNLSSDDLTALFTEIDGGGVILNMKEKRQWAKKITREKLRGELKKRNLTFKKSDKKVDLQSKLFGAILGSPVSTEGEPSNDIDEQNDGTTRTAKSEKMCWNKGNWLSFLENIGAQIDYLGILRLIYEGDDEKEIDRPKDVLVAYRKDQTYRETKMRLLQKLTGIEFLAMGYASDSDKRNWFKGYHVFRNLKDVEDRIATGQAISCFSTQEGLHIAFHQGEAPDSNVISYVTVVYDNTDFHIQETGVHFCRFVLKGKSDSGTVPVSTKTKGEVQSSIINYSLMLPFKKKGHPFLQQFTLVYDDWEVLRCKDGQKTKGPAAIDNRVFADVESLTWVNK